MSDRLATALIISVVGVRDGQREKRPRDRRDGLKANGWHAWGPLAEQRDTVSSVHFLLVTRRAGHNLAPEPS